ncbi:dihydropteroate synthase [Cognatishimia sp. SS12]|uniref:dihydropteroate synthase n=1 Tax=Cognatishimia sp. SS12 TaxID=2979465 RepID=UPI00232C8756|nr:dihydropteroate synthase [Cognatishimia sp. SS12]MDC0738095.1 dihydropteroate synthase [Cognatishimia sp. SS12]
MKMYFRPIVHCDPARPSGAQALAGGWGWFTHVERLRRGAQPEIIPASDVPAKVLSHLTAPRADVAGLSMSTPQIMGILNVTPDSFSDGGLFNAPAEAIARAEDMVRQGAGIIDIGGESTRPGAGFVPVKDEIDRTAPVIAAVAPALKAPISIDTRKAPVAEAALMSGAALINDVSGFTFDAALAPLAAARGVPVCVMHAQGDPATMQDDPSYDDVLLDVYDFLEAQVSALTALGLPRDQIVVDPGIGFGKTLAHNLALLARISLFHALGCPILLGASRKRFVGTIGATTEPQARMPGSVAVALQSVAQGVQFLRVHDVAETHQALRLWMAATTGEFDDS